MEQIDRENFFPSKYESMSNRNRNDFCLNSNSRWFLKCADSNSSFWDWIPHKPLWYNSQIDIDTSFCFEADLSAEGEEKKEERDDDKERPNGSALNCIPSAFIKKVINKSCTICVHLICQNGHDVIWWSQPIVS